MLNVTVLEQDGTCVHLLFADDFNTLRYELEERYRNIFNIDPITGEVFIPKGDSGRLDYETTKSYTVEITVKDRCHREDICYGTLYMLV